MDVMAQIPRLNKCSLLQYVFGFLLGLYFCFLFNFTGRPSPLANVPDYASAAESDELRHTAGDNHTGIPMVVSIMTARKYLSYRGCSVWRTWAKDFTLMGVKVKFFIGKPGKDENDSLEDLISGCPDIPLVVLQDVVDDIYPPQQKSFAMLKWLADNYGHRASWFLRTDDDVYVQGYKLLKFISGLERDQMHFVGQAGKGRANEVHKLALEWNENFCMGGPGMVFSAPLLVKLAPHLENCLSNVVTDHEDVELGRCITEATGKTCTWSYEMSVLFYHSRGDESHPRGFEIDPITLNPRIISNAITMHPLKNAENMETLHRLVLSMKRVQLLSTLQELRHSLATLPAPRSNDDPTVVMEDDIDDLPFVSDPSDPWEMVYNKQLYTVDYGMQKLPESTYQSILKVVSFILDKVNKDSREKGRTIEFRDLYYVYIQKSPKYGITYILDLLLIYKRFKGASVNLKVRRHVFVRRPLLEDYIVKTITTPEIPTPSVPSVMSGEHPLENSDVSMVTLLVTVAGSQKVEPLNRFINNYQTEVLTKLLPKVRLLIVAFKADKDDVEMVNALRENAHRLDTLYPDGSSGLKIVEKRGKFSRAIGLAEGLKAEAAWTTSTSTEVFDNSGNNIVFILDVDIAFSSEAIANVRRFVTARKSVYYPVVLSEFQGGVGGYWRDAGYGILAGYRRDLEEVGGFNTKIQGWGKEDVDLYEKFLHHGGFTIYRSPDPHLIHKYHKVNCSPDLASDQERMCKSSQANTYLSIEDLYALVSNYSDFNVH